MIDQELTPITYIHGARPADRPAFAVDDPAPIAGTPGVKPFQPPADLPVIDLVASAPVDGVDDGPVLWVPTTDDPDPVASQITGLVIPSARDCPTVRSALLAGVMSAYGGEFRGRKFFDGAGWDHVMQRAVINRVVRRPTVLLVGSHPLVVWVRHNQAIVGYVPHFSLMITGDRRVLLDVFPAEKADLDSMRRRVGVLTAVARHAGWEYTQLNGHRSDRLCDLGGGWVW